MYGGDNKQAVTGVPVTSAPPFPGQYPSAPGDWSVGAFDCCSDMSTCCIACWCPCITFGKIAEIVDRGSTSCGTSGALYALICCVTGCGWIYSCIYREKMRSQYKLDDGPCGDCLLHCCCEPCALVQEYRELQNRGYNMALGWHGNMERNAGVAMAPQFEGGMRR